MEIIKFINRLLDSTSIVHNKKNLNEVIDELEISAGPQGPQGEQGIQGPPGPQGEIGPIGPQGLNGDTGLAGPTGATGPKGDIGATGPAGVKGDKGDKGDIGLTGVQGPKGEKGDAGIQGLTGSKGDKGDKGETGSQGPKGNTGATGPQGLTGPQGIQGPIGPKGDKGDTAVSEFINVSLNNSDLDVTPYPVMPFTKVVNRKGDLLSLSNYKINIASSVKTVKITCNVWFYTNNSTAWVRICDKNDRNLAHVIGSDPSGFMSGSASCILNNAGGQTIYLAKPNNSVKINGGSGDVDATRLIVEVLE